MKFSFFNPFLFSISLFLLIYAAGYLPLANALAAGVSLGIICNIAYPHIRGVKKGDLLSIVSGPSISSNLPNVIKIVFGAMMSTTATAVQNGKKGDIITVLMDDGTDAKGLVISYAGMFSTAEIKIVTPPKIVSPHAEVEVY